MLVLLKIPFRFSKLISCMLCSIKIIHGILPAFLLIELSSFIDNTILFLQGESNFKIMPLFFYGILISVKWISTILFQLAKKRMFLNLEEGVREIYFSKVSKIAYADFEHSNTQELLHRIRKNMTNRYGNGFITSLNLVEYILHIISLLTILSLHIWWGGILVLLCILPILISAFRNGKEDYSAFEEADEYRRVADYYHEILTTRTYVKERNLFDFSGALISRWEAQSQKANKVEFAANKKIFRRTILISSFTTVGAVLIIGSLIYPVYLGMITAGLFISSTKAIWELVHKMSWEVSTIIKNLTADVMFAKDMKTFHGLKETLDLSSQGKGNSKPQISSITFEHVSFTYPTQTNPTLKDVSFHLIKGKQYAFVGDNGAGKTTIIKLLLGFYDTYNGSIKINNKELRTYSLEERQNFFSAAFQDYAQYWLSIYDNLRLGNQSLEKDALDQALTDMQLKEYVDSLSCGGDTLLGKLEDNSIDLSGGQWQKLILSRVILSNAPVYILDEPTASIDPLEERRLFQLFSDLKEIKVNEKIILFITHRLGAAKLSNHIFVLKDGIITEEGSHETLLKKNGNYAAMYKAQKEWYDAAQ